MLTFLSLDIVCEEKGAEQARNNASDLRYEMSLHRGIAVGIVLNARRERR